MKYDIIKNRNVMIANTSFENVALANQSSILCEIKNRLMSGNAFCHSVQNHLSFSSLKI